MCMHCLTYLFIRIHACIQYTLYSKVTYSTVRYIQYRVYGVHPKVYVALHSPIHLGLLWRVYAVSRTLTKIPIDHSPRPRDKGANMDQLQPPARRPRRRANSRSSHPIACPIAGLFCPYALNSFVEARNGGPERGV